MTSPQPQQSPSTATILAALVAALAAGAAVSAFVYLLARLAGIERTAVRLLFDDREAGPELRQALQVPRPATGRWTEPQFAQYSQNLHRRAAYLVNAARRVSRADDRRAAVRTELRYWRQHRAAQRARDRAARRVAESMRTNGPLLGWYAVRDSRTTPDCRAAHGRNFDARRIPPIGYPGTVHGPECRCRPGPPFATRRRVESIRPDRRRSA